MVKLRFSPGRHFQAIGFFVCASILVISIHGCRTIKPHAAVPGEISQSSQIQDQPVIDLDDPSLGSSAALWSPAQRRAQASYHYLVAMREALGGNGKRSLSYLESTYNLDPNSYVGSQLVELKLLSGRGDEALEDAHRMTLLYPKEARLKLKYAQVLLLKDGDRGLATEELQSALALDPRLEEGYLLLARVQLEQKSHAKAVQTLKKLTATNPASHQGFALLARIYIVQKQYKDALDAARQWWVLQPSQPEAVLVYGLSLDLNQRRKEAISMYESLYRMNPVVGDVAGRMVALHRELGNLESALSLIDDLLERSEDKHPGLVIQKALILSELGRDLDASSLLEDLVKQHSDSDRILFISGMALEKVGKVDVAASRYERIPEDSVVRLPANYRMAVIALQKGEADKSIAIMRQSIARSDADAETYQIFATIYSQLKRLEDALAITMNGSKRYPDNLSLLFMRGGFEERLGKFSEAEKTMRSIIALKHDHDGALNFLGYMLAEQGRNLDEAEALIKKALEIKPGDGSYLDSLGWVLFKKGDIISALDVLKDALKASPQEGVIMEHIGDCYVKLDDWLMARQYYEQAMSTELDDRDRPRIEAKFREASAKAK